MKTIYKIITSTLFSAGLMSSFVGVNNAQALEAVEFASFQNKLFTVSDSDSEVTMDGVLSASKKEILVGEDSADVIFYFKTLADSDQFMLYENDVPVGCFTDSGNYEQDGDDIKGDGVYSLKITVDVTGDNAKPTDNSKVVYNTYNVRYGDEIVSDEATIDLIMPFTDQDLIDMSSVDNAIDELMKSDEFKAMNQQEKIDSLMALLTNLSEKKLVNSIVLNEDRIEFLYSSEASGMILFTSFDEKTDGITTAVTETSTTTTTIVTTTTSNAESTSMTVKSEITSTATEITPTSITDATTSTIETTIITTTHIASDEDLCNWAVKDYESKTGETPANAEIEYTEEGIAVITLTDAEGNVLDVYNIDPITGIGTEIDGDEVNLPQTGYSKWYQALIAAAIGMIGLGSAVIVKSGIFRKKENNS